ncbi:hypothetical protein MIR68_000793 [Amoeboaphelidium protococcarum]|nr:hypothetical protein MIR68_000793 [Amoeboaphelidium protococcarum]
MTVDATMPFQNCDFDEIEVSDQYKEVIQCDVNSKPLDGTPFVAPFVKCPQSVIKFALQSLHEDNLLSPSNAVMDLGCGDGQILQAFVEFASHVSNKAERPRVIGIELDQKLQLRCIKNLTALDTDFDWVIDLKDIFSIDLNDYKPDILILYLLPGGLDQLMPLIKGWNRDRRRVVAIQYKFSDIAPRRQWKLLMDQRFEYLINYYEL